MRDVVFIFAATALCLFGEAEGENSLMLDDGPHVFWQNDSAAVVFYFCDSTIESKIVYAHDTVRFQGFCRDSNVTYTIPCLSYDPQPYIYSDVSKIFAISDIHGDLDSFTEILVNSGVTDASLSWSFGRGHLIVNGDVLDRGAEVTECLWLIHRLEQEAEKAGGRVHFILGNHELMVLRGDLRYVHERYTEGIAYRSRFRYDELFGTDTELGRWLRSKNTAELINDILFVHGGIAPRLVIERMGLDEINNAVRQGLDYSSVELQFDKSTKYLFGSEGPLWYRGYLMPLENWYPETSPAQIDSLLELYGASYVVVGHSQMDSVTVAQDGRLLAIDIVVEDLGHQMALYWEDGLFYCVSSTGEKRLLNTK